MKNYKSQILTALTVSLIAGSAVFAANVANEAELRAALDNVGGDPTINLTAPITLTSELTLPDAVYTINGAGNNLTTVNNLSVPLNVTVDNLLINNIETYAGMVAAQGAVIEDWGGGNHEFDNRVLFNNINSTNVGAGGASISIFNGSLWLKNGVTFTNNYAIGNGGAMYVFGGAHSTRIDNGATFIGNTANKGAGAVRNGGAFEINGGAIFKNNTAETNAGGAIHNNGTLTINDGAVFAGNSAGTWGGAIYNTDTLLITDGAIFKNNSAGEKAGAIYAGDFGVGGTTLIAKTNNIEFTGNTVNGQDNAIHMVSFGAGFESSLNLNASNTNSIIFNDGISCENNNGIIRINATNAEDANIPVDAPTSGRVYLNADMSGFGNTGGATGNTVNLHNGTLQLGPQGKFFTVADFTAANGTNLNLDNGKIDTLLLGTADIDGMNMRVDADLASGLSDSIDATGVVTNNDITITKINVINEGNTNNILNIDPDNEFDITIAPGTGTAEGKVFNYNISENNGKLSFIRTRVNPVVQSSGVSQQNAYLNVANTNNIAFNRADNVLNMMDNIKFLTGVDYDNANKVAILEGQPEYSKLYGRLEEGAVWFRPFNSIENITIDGVEGKVDSTSYGMLLGFDSPLKRFKKGFKGMLSVYGGYGGASQEYKTIDLYQNGGLIGVMGSLYKGDLYTSLSASVGGYGVLEKIKNYGSSNYGLLTTSVASKTGYNFHLPGRTVLQLNGQAAYSFVSSNDYDNAQGTRIDTAPLHVLQITPGVKLSKHIGSWQPYLSTSVVFNALNDSAVRANDIALPDTQIGDYIEYGAGVEKHTESGTSGFLQAMVRNGSRSGINFKFGLKFPVGKQKEKI